MLNKVLIGMIVVLFGLMVVAISVNKERAKAEPATNAVCAWGIDSDSSQSANAIDNVIGTGFMAELKTIILKGIIGLVAVIFIPYLLMEYFTEKPKF